MYSTGYAYEKVGMGPGNVVIAAAQLGMGNKGLSGPNSSSCLLVTSPTREAMREVGVEVMMIISSRVENEDVWVY